MSGDPSQCEPDAAQRGDGPASAGGACPGGAGPQARHTPPGAETPQPGAGVQRPDWVPRAC